jgi:hypothetical protein
MKVLGISGSPRRNQTTEGLVEAVLSTVGCETELISLADKTVGPCIACLGCVEDNVCKVDDDIAENGLTHCFLERFYQFRHRGGREVAGKLGVAVGAAGQGREVPVQVIKTFFEYHGIDCVDGVSAIGPPSCFVCGYGESCEVGAIHAFFGAGTRITEEITPDLSKQPDRIDAARDAGRRLGERLRAAKE